MPKLYTIAVETEDAGYGMIYGPTESLKECVDFWPIDHEEPVYILEFSDASDKGTKLFKFNSKRKEWTPFSKVGEYTDPVFSDRYSALLRTHSEIKLLYGSTTRQGFKSSELFFGDKADLSDPDDQSQYICVYHNNALSRIYTDRIRLESDTDTVRRDIEWVRHALEEAYRTGWFDGLAARLGKKQPAKTAQQPQQVELPLGGGDNKTIKRIK